MNITGAIHYYNNSAYIYSIFFSRKALESILNKIENTSYRIVEEQIFPHATDMFVHIFKTNSCNQI
jgi:hypothetical protein